MRNLKRVLSLALALVMVLGMMVITTSAADFNDADEITYTEAMDVLAGVGLYQGDDKGNVNPQQILTRKDAATLMARIILGDKMAAGLSPTQQIFDDVPVDHWAAAAIEYCYNIDMIAGYNGKFDPDGQLTGTAFAKLLLCAMGYDAGAEGYEGDKWSENINADALTAGLMIKGVNISAPLTREGAAQMILQAMEGKMVDYTIAYDYATGAQIKVGPNYVTTGNFWNTKNVLFMDKYFSTLAKVEGTITNTVASAGKTTLATASGAIVLSNTEGDWTDVGYAARAWYNTKTNKALSLIVTGEDLYVGTDGTVITALTTKTNPKYVASMNTTDAGVVDVDYYLNGEVSTSTAVAAANKIGAKVALVDNNADGAVDSVVAAKYTTAKVTGIVKKSISGEISIAYYALSNGQKIAPSELVGVDALVPGQYITYIAIDTETDVTDYNTYDYFYVNVAETATTTLDAITWTTVGGTSVKTYTVGGAPYVTSGLTSLDYSALNSGNLNELVTIAVDEYGYIIFAELFSDPNAYLYVIDNNHSNNLTKTAETKVAYADGTVAIVDVATGEGTVGATVNAGTLGNNRIYQYATNKDGNTVLTNVTDWAKTATYVEDEVAFGGIALTEKTVIVDLRTNYVGTVYNGYFELPSLTNAKIVYIKDNSGAMSLGYLVSGINTADYTDSFVVFNTAMNVETLDKNTKIYTLTAGVLVKGEVVPSYELSAAEAAKIAQFGVGVYSFDAYGNLTYKSFAEKTVTWKPETSGKVIDGITDITNTYTTVILDVSKGTVNEWNQYVKDGVYYAYKDVKNKIIYIVGDDTVAGGSILAPNAAVTGTNGGVDYVAADGYVTRTGTKLTIAAKTLNGSTDLVNMSNTNDVYTAAVSGAYNEGETVIVTATRKTGGIFVDGTYYTMELSNGEKAMAVGDGTKTLSFEFTVTAATAGALTVKNITRVTTPADAVVGTTDSYLCIKTTADRVALANDLAFATINDSLIAEIYSGSTLLGTVTLKDGIQPSDGVLSVNIVVSGRASSSWISDWTPSADQLPTNVKFIQDGVQVWNALVCKTFNADTGAAVELAPADWQALFA